MCKLSVGEISFSHQMDNLVSITTCSLGCLNYLLRVAFYFLTEKPCFPKEARLVGLCLSSLAAGLVDRFHAGVMEGGHSVAT